MPIPDNQKVVAEVTVTGVIAAGGSNALTIHQVFHFRRTFQGGVWDNAGIGAAWITQYITAYAALINAAYTGTVVNCRCINDALDLGVDVAEVTPGGVAGDRLTDFCCATMIFKSAIRGRSWQGKKHFAPMSESDVGDDVFNAGCVTRLNSVKTAIAAGFTDANGNIFVPCVYSRILSQAKVNPTNILTADVVTILVNKTVGSMKKRKAKTIRA